MKISVKQYAKLLNSLEGLNKKELLEAINRLVLVIKKNRDESKVDEIGQAFGELQGKRSGLIRAEVKSARELNKSQLGSIKKAIAIKNKVDIKNIELELKVDKDLRGGLLVNVQNEVIDGTVKSRLGRLREVVVN